MFHRKGGGIGDSNIRKMAYFESFVDDTYKASVHYLILISGCVHVSTIFCMIYRNVTRPVLLHTDAQAIVLSRYVCINTQVKNSIIQVRMLYNTNSSEV